MAKTKISKTELMVIKIKSEIIHNANFEINRTAIMDKLNKLPFTLINNVDFLESVQMYINSETASEKEIKEHEENRGGCYQEYIESQFFKLIDSYGITESTQLLILDIVDFIRTDQIRLEYRGI